MSAVTDIPRPAFADDDGSVDPQVHHALTTSEDLFTVVNALVGTRLLVPVVAVLDEVEASEAGIESEKDSHMASVTLINSDGRRGLLAFTSIDSLRTWNPDARPVPVPARSAAQAAIQEADALLIDIAGPGTWAIEGPGLFALADGREWLPPIDDRELHATITAALALLTADGWVNVRIEPSPNADVMIVLELPGGGHPDGRGPRELAQAAAAALERNPMVAQRLITGLQIAVDVQ